METSNFHRKNQELYSFWLTSNEKTFRLSHDIHFKKLRIRKILFNYVSPVDSYYLIKVNNYTYGLDASALPEIRYTLAYPVHTGSLSVYQNYERGVWDAEFANCQSTKEFTFTVYEGRNILDSSNFTTTPMYIELELDE